MKLKVLELFAGIGAFSKSLTNLGIEHEIVDAVEIDKYAIKSFNAIHGTNFEPQDICAWDKDIECDIIMHGSPCQDFSVAGKQAGGDKDSGTRSSLMYETLRIVEKLQPEVVIWENVKNLLGKRHIHNWHAYTDHLCELGYDSAVAILNAKDFGIPQNRERAFTVSIKFGSKLVKDFAFPEPMPLEKKLKDMLEDEVDERYYLSESQMKTYQRDFGSKGKELTGSVSPTLTASMGTGGANTPYLDTVRVIGNLGIKGHDQIRRVYDKEGLSPTLSTMQGGNRQPKIVASRGRGENNEQHLEPRKDDLTNTITSVQKDNYVARNFRIRKLTPKECWRLMGFTDEDFNKAQSAGISNTQLYKQAGNSIVVNVLEEIVKGFKWQTSRI